MEGILGRNGQNYIQNFLDFSRLGMASQDRQDAVGQRRQAEWDRAFQHTPEGQRGPIIDRGVKDRSIPPEAGTALHTKDILSAASRAGGGIDQTTKRPINMDAFMNYLASKYDPSKHDASSIINELSSVGITANTINSYRGKPGMDPFVNKLIGKVEPVSSAAGTFWDAGTGPLFTR